MSLIRSIVAGAAGLAASLPLLAQSLSPNLAGATYLSAELGTGKVGLNCPANTPCSRVDANRVLRAGHRFDESWAFEVVYNHIDADWGFLGANYSAEFTGVGVGAAYFVPVSASVSALLRVGAASNDIKLQPAVGLASKNPGTTSTSAVKPYAGLGLSWQFARHWSASVNVDVTRAELRDTAASTKQGVTVRTAGAGIAFNF